MASNSCEKNFRQISKIKTSQITIGIASMKRYFFRFFEKKRLPFLQAISIKNYTDFY